MSRLLAILPVAVTVTVGVSGRDAREKTFQRSTCVCITGVKFVGFLFKASRRRSIVTPSSVSIETMFAYGPAGTRIEAGMELETPEDRSMRWDGWWTGRWTMRRWKDVGDDPGGTDGKVSGRDPWETKDHGMMQEGRLLLGGLKRFPATSRHHKHRSSGVSTS